MSTITLQAAVALLADDQRTAQQNADGLRDSASLFGGTIDPFTERSIEAHQARADALALALTGLGPHVAEHRTQAGEEEPMTDPAGHLLAGELAVITLLANAWNAFCRLEQTHPSDVPELQSAIHRAEDIVACRLARRVVPSVFITRSTDAGGVRP
ncbi:MAG: hypothetical protein V4617_15225 [Gemmatimonadota bacterium]